MSNRIIAWHFLPNNRRFRFGDGRKAEVGRVYSVEPPLKLCMRGLHASRRIYGALDQAPGSVLGRVVSSGEMIHGDYKLCAEHREYLWIADVKQTLRDHARWCALQVIDHWDAPDFVRQYFESGDESLRGEAWAAAHAASKSHTGALSWAASRAAVWAASRTEAYAVARESAKHAEPATTSIAKRRTAKATQQHDIEQRLFALGAPEAL